MPVCREIWLQRWTPLLTAKKFRSRANKDGALRAFSKIEEVELEEALKQARWCCNQTKLILTLKYHYSNNYELTKIDIPTEKDTKIELARKLGKYGVSLNQSFTETEISVGYSNCYTHHVLLFW